MKWSALLLCCSCSWIFVEKAPPNHQQLSRFDCTESSAAPVVDTIAAALSGLVSVAEFAASDQTLRDANLTRGQAVAAGAIYGGLAIVEIASASYGYGHTSQCRAAKQELMARGVPAPGFDRAPLGCTKDTDCKGDRICAAGMCVDPAPVK